MSKRPQQKRMRCGDCGKLASGLVGGRCPHCESIAEALRSDWTCHGTLARRFQRPSDGRQLAVTVAVQPHACLVVAIETPADTRTPEQMLVRHAHHSLGTFSTLPEALATGEAFAKEWLHGRINVDDCACETIRPVRAKIGKVAVR